MALGDLVHEMLTQLVKDANIEMLGIEHRVKKERCLAGKLARKGDKYLSLDDLTDILGARMICFFSDDVDRIGKLVEKTFVIDWENCADKRALIEANSFGYLSLHYICSLPTDRGYPEELCGKRFEIQIRTILQHTWSVINHDLGYKSEFGIPRGIAYISSAGLHVFLKAQKRMNINGRMKLVHVNDAVMEVLDITGFADILNMNNIWWNQTHGSKCVELMA